MDNSFEERIWSLHCRGYAVPEIAAKLKTDTGRVRRIIVDKWAGDSMLAAMEGLCGGGDL